MVGASGDAVAVGTAPDGMPWRVGIADPRRADDPQGEAVLDVVEMGDGLDPGPHALATSGTAQHGEHIWNPRSEGGRAAYAQVSVAGRDLVECDAWATAIVAGGAEVALAAQRRGLEVLCIPPVAGGEGGAIAAEASPGWPGIALR
jgi:thiamine biosynthesis lipoprotein